jgi:hypothetical protein
MPVQPIPATTTTTRRRLALMVPGHSQSDDGREVDRLASGLASRPMPQRSFPADSRTGPQALQRTIGRVWDVFSDEEEVTEDSQRVSLHAADTACRLLAEAYFHMGSQFPTAGATSDDTGGLYVYWSSPSRQLHLHVPGSSDKGPSAFHRTASDYGSVQNVDAAALAYWLDWLGRA